MLGDIYDPLANPDPGAKPVTFDAAQPQELAAKPEISPNGEYMSVDAARKRAIMRSGYTPARAGGQQRPAEAASSSNIYNDTSAVRGGNYEQTGDPLGDIELAENPKPANKTGNQQGGNQGGGNQGGGNQGNGAGEKGFWTTGKIIIAVVATLVILGVSFGVPAALGAFPGQGGGGKQKKKPVAKPVTLTGQAAGNVVIDILGGKDAMGNAWVAAGDGTLAASGVKLRKGMDAVASLTVDNEGTWSVDSMTGKITFTPLAAFKGSPTPVNYFVTDSNLLASDNAAISITYAATGTIPAVTNPVAANIVLTDQLPGKVSIDILNGKDANGNAYFTKGTGAVKGNGVFLVSAQGMGQQLDVTNEGTWLADTSTGIITFTPVDGFTGSPTPIRWKLRDDSASPLASNEATITITLKMGPLAKADVDGSFARAAPADVISVTVDVLANDAKGAAALDPASVKIVRAIASDPSYMPMVTIAADGKSADIMGEGKWTVDPASGKMTFAALQGFNGQTTAIAYTVADTNKIRSNEAIVQLNSDIKKVSDGLQTLVDGTDLAFWTEFKKLAIDDPNVSIRELLVVTSLYNDLFVKAIPPALLATLNSTGRAIGTEFSGYETQWLNAGGTKDALWTIMQTVQANRYMKFPEATNKLAVRYLCTDVMVRLLRVLVASMNKMQQ